MGSLTVEFLLRHLDLAAAAATAILGLEGRFIIPAFLAF